MFDQKNEEVWTRIKKRIEIIGECWIVTGWNDGKGYQKISIGGHGYYVHRFSFKRFNPDVPLLARHQVDHKCCNRTCCNPEHLQRVTNLVNSRLRDSRAKKAKKNVKG